MRSRSLSYSKAAQLLATAVLLLACSVASRAQTTDTLPDAPTPRTVDLAQNNEAPQQAPETKQSQQPSSSSTEPSLSDLGLTTVQTQGSAQAQALLDKRTHMLKVHQTLGLLTLIPLAATVISSAGATGGHQHNGSTIGSTSTGNTVGRDLHASLGAVSIGMYAATAWYAIRAPKIPDTQSRGAIRLHKALVWIHAPGMVLTPVLGVMAFKQLNSGERVHGIASAHAAVAWTTVAAYGASIVAVSWPIHLKY